MFIYLWFEACGWSRTEPTPEDERSIEDGNLTVIRVVSRFKPQIHGVGQMVECKIDRTPDGEPYHYVP